MADLETMYVVDSRPSFNLCLLHTAAHSYTRGLGDSCAGDVEMVERDRGGMGMWFKSSVCVLC